LASCSLRLSRKPCCLLPSRCVERLYPYPQSISPVLLTVSDYLRPDDPGVVERATWSARSDLTASQALCCWTKADSSTALCLPGHPGDPDEGMERRPALSCTGPQWQSSKSRLHPGLPASASRRGHRGSQDHPVCTWSEILPSAAPALVAKTYERSKSARNTSLMIANRKKIWPIGLRLYLATTQPKSCSSSSTMRSRHVRSNPNTVTEHLADPL
jgi:hypothetical protein